MDFLRILIKEDERRYVDLGRKKTTKDTTDTKGIEKTIIED